MGHSSPENLRCADLAGPYGFEPIGVQATSMISRLGSKSKSYFLPGRARYFKWSCNRRPRPGRCILSLVSLAHDSLSCIVVGLCTPQQV